MTLPSPAPDPEQTSPRSLAEKAYRLLLHKITRLDYPPGAILAEKALISELEIGRTPIREALQRLAIEGLVQHMPNRGMFVAEISASSVQQIYEFRKLIDGYAARLAAVRASDQDIGELQEIQAQLVQATDDDDIDSYVDLDRQFYHGLARAAQNIYLAEVIPRIFNLHLRLWFFISRRRGSWHPIARSHEEMTKQLVGAVARRDPEEAELAVKIYVTRRHQDIRDVL